MAITQPSDTIEQIRNAAQPAHDELMRRHKYHVMIREDMLMIERILDQLDRNENYKGVSMYTEIVRSHIQSTKDLLALELA